MILGYSVLMWGLGTSLGLAIPLMIASKKLLGQRIRFFRAFMMILAIDVLSHWLSVLLHFVMGVYRPAVSMDLTLLTINFVLFILVGMAVGRAGLGPSGEQEGLASWQPGFALVTAVIIMIKDLVLYFALAWWVANILKMAAPAQVG